MNTVLDSEQCIQEIAAKDIEANLKRHQGLETDVKARVNKFLFFKKKKFYILFFSKCVASAECNQVHVR